MLNDVLDKAPQTPLDVTRHAESNAAHNFALPKQSLEDQLRQDNKALTKAKADNSEFASSLEAERADLAEAEKSKSSAEELKALADATQVLKSVRATLVRCSR